MVVRRTIHNLKERSKEERKAIATWIAIGVIIVLLLTWAIASLVRFTPAPAGSTIQTASTTDTFDSHFQTR